MHILNELLLVGTLLTTEANIPYVCPCHPDGHDYMNDTKVEEVVEKKPATRRSVGTQRFYSMLFMLPDGGRVYTDAGWEQLRLRNLDRLESLESLDIDWDAMQESVDRLLAEGRSAPPIMDKNRPPVFRTPGMGYEGGLRILIDEVFDEGDVPNVNTSRPIHPDELYNPNKTGKVSEYDCGCAKVIQ